MRIALSGWVLGVAVAGAGAQAPIERRAPAAAQLPTLQSQSRLVNVVVNAVDANGAPVGGLQKADFAIAEDGKQEAIAFFDRESTTPLSLVLAIDGSESVLTNQRLEKEAAKKFVKALLRTGPADSDELDLMEFDEEVHELTGCTADPHRIDSGVDGLRRGDATAMYDAVYLASGELGKRTGGGRRRVLVLISDGGDTGHDVGYERAVAEAQKDAVAVYPLIVVPIAADAGRNTGGEHALIQMAADTGGKFYYVNDPRDLSAAFAKLSNDLRTQYTVGYYAPEPTVQSRRDGYRVLNITLTDPATAAKVHLHFRTGYYAGK